MGHVHLRVADVPATVEFYRDGLGFALMAQLGSQAAFLAAGGYHHHLGANTWESRGAPRAPEGTARLELATIVVPDSGAVDLVVDRAAAHGQTPEPTGHGVRLSDPSAIRSCCGHERDERRSGVAYEGDVQTADEGDTMRITT